MVPEDPDAVTDAAARPTEQHAADDPDVVVLRRTANGLSAADYAQTLRDRLPEREVVHARTPEAERRLIREASIATGLAIDEALLAEAANLDLFAATVAGTDHLPLEAFEERGIPVTNASGVHATPIAEYVVGWLLSFSARFHKAERQRADGEWRSYPKDELAGSTVTVIGLGAIGTAVVDRLAPFGVETIGIRYTPEKGGPTDEVVGFDRVAVHDALSRSEYVVLACPLTDVTEGLLDHDAFQTMPSEAVLVNIARGPVVDTDALVWALGENAIRGAALDVTDPEPLPNDHPLWDFGNVHITPHNAGYTPKYWERMADIIAENVKRMEAGSDDLRNRVV
jgi:phosphoglycerate dehydrogenase-like enzyme